MTPAKMRRLLLLVFSINFIYPEAKVFKSVQHRQTSDTEMEVSWIVYQGQSLTWDYRITYSYRLAQVGDCQPVLRARDATLALGPGRRSLKLGQLWPWRTYQYKLKAPLSHFREEDLEIGLFSTRPAYVPASSVRDVTVQNVTATTADVSWQEPPCLERNGPLRRFDLQLLGPDAQMVLNAYTAVYVTVSNLRPATAYQVRIRYVNAVGPGPFTDTVNFTTAGVDLPSRRSRTAPEYPFEELVDQQPEGQTKGWDKTGKEEVVSPAMDAGSAQGLADQQFQPNLPANAMRLPDFPAVGSQIGPVPVDPTEDLGRSFQTFGNNTGFEVHCRDPSNDPCAPINLQQVKNDFHCVTIQWSVTDPYRTIISFQIFSLGGVDVNKLKQPLATPPGASTTADVCGFHPGRYYDLGMRSLDGQSGVSPMAHIRVHTKHSAPPKPARPEYVGSSTSTITMYLRVVSDRLGPVTSYYVVVMDALLTEIEKVDAGIASAPIGFLEGNPIFPDLTRNFDPADNKIAQQKQPQIPAQGRGQPKVPIAAAQVTLQQEEGSDLGPSQPGRDRSYVQQLGSEVKDGNRLPNRPLDSNLGGGKRTEFGDGFAGEDFFWQQNHPKSNPDFSENGSVPFQLSGNDSQAGDRTLEGGPGEGELTGARNLRTTSVLDNRLTAASSNVTSTMRREQSSFNSVTDSSITPMTLTVVTSNMRSTAVTELQYKTTLTDGGESSTHGGDSSTDGRESSTHGRESSTDGRESSTHGGESSPLNSTPTPKYDHVYSDQSPKNTQDTPMAEVGTPFLIIRQVARPPDYTIPLVHDDVSAEDAANVVISNGTGVATNQADRTASVLLIAVPPNRQELSTDDKDVVKDDIKSNDIRDQNRELQSAEELENFKTPSLHPIKMRNLTASGDLVGEKVLHRSLPSIPSRQTYRGALSADYGPAAQSAPDTSSEASVIPQNVDKRNKEAVLVIKRSHVNVVSNPQARRMADSASSVSNLLERLQLLGKGKASVLMPAATESSAASDSRRTSLHTARTEKASSEDSMTSQIAASSKVRFGPYIKTSVKPESKSYRDTFGRAVAYPVSNNVAEDTLSLKRSGAVNFKPDILNTENDKIGDPGLLSADLKTPVLKNNNFSDVMLPSKTEASLGNAEQGRTSSILTSLSSGAAKLMRLTTTTATYYIKSAREIVAATEVPEKKKNIKSDETWPDSQTTESVLEVSNKLESMSTKDVSGQSADMLSTIDSEKKSWTDLQAQSAVGRSTLDHTSANGIFAATTANEQISHGDRQLFDVTTTPIPLESTKHEEGSAGEDLSSIGGVRTRPDWGGENENVPDERAAVNSQALRRVRSDRDASREPNRLGLKKCGEQNGLVGSQKDCDITQEPTDLPTGGEKQPNPRPAQENGWRQFETGTPGEDEEGVLDLVREVLASGKASARTRSRLARNNGDDTVPHGTMPSGQIVAEIMGSDLRDYQTFVVGDQQTYNGFVNTPLSADGRYKIYLVANSRVEYVLFSSSDPLLISMPLEPMSSGMYKHRRRDNYIWMGVMIGLAFIVMVIFLILKCVKYNRQIDETVTCACCRFHVPDRFYFLSDDADPGLERVVLLEYETIERHWSDTYTLSEPRFIVTGRYLVQPTLAMENAVPNPDRPVGAMAMSFRKEFQCLPRAHPTNGMQAGKRHRDLNNNPNVLPYDATRVVLDHDGTGLDDYINASYITGYMDDNGRRSCYIAAQCPFDEATTVAMWRMVYQNSVSAGVLLCRAVEDGLIKCATFWPETGQRQWGPFEVQMMEQFTYAHYAELQMSLRKSGREDEVRLVTFFCFASWPDKGTVPQDAVPLVELNTRVHKSHSTETTPLLVMCDTGSGRSAVFIAMDILLSQYASENQASMYEVVCALRSERPSMVQTFPQYALVYQAVLEEMHAGDTWISADDMRDRYRDLSRVNPNTGRTYLRDQFALLELMFAKDGELPLLVEGEERPEGGDPASAMAAAAAPEVPDVIPPARPTLTYGYLTPPRNVNYNSNPEPALAGGELELVMGTFVDGYRQRNHYLVMKNPLMCEFNDFWQLIYENNVRSVVAMEQPLRIHHEMSEAGRQEYWPAGGSAMFDHFLVELMEEAMVEGVIIRTFRLSHMHRSREQPRLVRQFQFHAWNQQDKEKLQPQQQPPRPLSLRWTAGRPEPPMHSESVQSMRRPLRPPCPPSSSRSAMLNMVSLVKQWQEKTTVDCSPVVVHCQDGRLCSGLFVAVSLVTARMDEEAMVSVYRVCRQLRKAIPYVINSFEQYKYLFRALWDHVNLPSDYDFEWSPLQSPTGSIRGDAPQGWGRGLAGSPLSRPMTCTGRQQETTPRKAKFMQTMVPSSDYDTQGMTSTEESQGTCVYLPRGRPSPCPRQPPPCYTLACAQPGSLAEGNFRFMPHRLAVRPPRCGGATLPRMASPAAWRTSTTTGGSPCPCPQRELPPAPKCSPCQPAAPPCHGARTPCRAVRSCTPSPVPRNRTQSASPCGRAKTSSSSPVRRRNASRSRNSRCPSGPDAVRMTTPTRAPVSERGSRCSSPDSGHSVSLVQETTEMMDECGVFYRQEVTDTLREVSCSTGQSESDF